MGFAKPRAEQHPVHPKSRLSLSDTVQVPTSLTNRLAAGTPGKSQSSQRG